MLTTETFLVRVAGDQSMVGYGGVERRLVIFGKYHSSLALAHQAILSCGEELSSAARGPLILAFIICRFLQSLLVDLCQRRSWSMTTTTRPLQKCSYQLYGNL
jgi:hypothetical protein